MNGIQFLWLPWFSAQNKTCAKICNTVYTVPKRSVFRDIDRKTMYFTMCTMDALCRIWKIMRSCKQLIIIKYPFLSFGKSFCKSPKRFLHVEEFRLSVLCWLIEGEIKKIMTHSVIKIKKNWWSYLWMCPMP